MADASTTDDAADDRRTDLEEHWIAVLGEFWLQADWDRFGGRQQSRSDTFGERLHAAKSEGDVHGALEKLAQGLGLAVPDLPTEHLDPLVDEDRAAMRVLRREHVWLIAKVDEAVTSYYDALDVADDGDAAADEPAPTTDLSDFISTEDDE